MSTPLDLDFVRAQFPAMARGYTYLDNAGGSQVPQQVVSRISDYLLGTNVQTGASYSESQQASTKVLQARESVMQLVNARRSEECVMGGSTTLLMFLLCQALLPGIEPGDEIILTNTDHESNIGAWLRLAERGAVIKFWDINPDTLALELDDLDRLLCVDAVAYAPHRLVDVQASGADCYVFSFYKVFGPHYAVLWGDYDFLRSLPSLNHFFIGPDVVPYKLQPGNVNYELSYGCMGINDYLKAVAHHMGVSADPTNPRHQMQAAFDAFEAHEEALAERLLSWLRAQPNIRIIGHTESDAALRVPTISFMVKDRTSESIVRAVDPHNIGIRHGDFYARRLIQFLGLEPQGGVVRVSIAHYNTFDEMDRLVKALEQAV